MKKFFKSKTFLGAVLSIALCVSLIAGATFAIFTSEANVNIAVTSGTVKVIAEIGELKTYSGVNLSGTSDDVIEETATAGKFTNGGTAEKDGNTIKITGITPGDKVTFPITIKNLSNVNVKYRTAVEKSADSDANLYGALEFTIGGMIVDGKSSWYDLAPATDDNGTVIATYECSIELPSTVSGEDYMGKTCNLSFKVEAVQGNASTTTYAPGITTKSFDEAQNVEYTNNLGNVVTGNKPAVAAYVDGEGQVKYVGDIYSAVKNGASVIYCKEGVTLRMRERLEDTNRTPDLTKDLTIYANGADFQYGEISMNMTDAGKAANITLRVLDAKNIKIWGATPNDGVKQNIVLENCHNEGETATDGKGILMYITGSTGTVNAIVKNCYISKNSSGIYMSTNGSLTVLDSTFVECATGIKSSYKGTGTRNDLIENCTFVNCGCTKEMAGTTDWLYEDSAAIKCKNSNGGKFNLTLKNNTITGTIGDKGDMQIAAEVNAGTVAKIEATEGKTAQEALEEAFKGSIKTITVDLEDGTYTLPGQNISGKDITIIGTKDTVIDIATGLAAHNSTIAMEGVTVKSPNANYTGLQHTAETIFKNCYIQGQPFLYAKNVEYIGCTFAQDDSGSYNVWTYGAENVLFKDCTFNCAGKSVLIYNEGSLQVGTVEFQNCEFNASVAVSGKAAIEIDCTYTSYNVIIDQATADNVNGFGAGSVSGNSVWNVKLGSKPTTVTVAGTVVYNK